MLTLLLASSVLAARLLMLDPLPKLNICDVRTYDIAEHTGHSFATIPGACPQRVVVHPRTLEVFYHRDGATFAVIGKGAPRFLGKTQARDWVGELKLPGPLWDTRTLSSTHSKSKRYVLKAGGRLHRTDTGEWVMTFENAPLIVWLP